MIKLMKENIVSTSDVTKQFTTVRKTVKSNDCVFIFKNNTPDMVLLDFEVYTDILKEIDSLKEELENAHLLALAKERVANASGITYTSDEVAEEVRGWIKEKEQASDDNNELSMTM